VPHPHPRAPLWVRIATPCELGETNVAAKGACELEAIEGGEGPSLTVLRLGERRVCEAGYEGMIGRTLAEEEIAATGNRSRFSDARQLSPSRPPLKKKQWVHQPLSALAGYPQTSGFLAIPPS
jgi:hypothetical protein